MKKLLKKQTNKLIGLHNMITGNITGITGNLDKCEITEEDRKNGIDISDLIGVIAYKHDGSNS